MLAFKIFPRLIIMQADRRIRSKRTAAYIQSNLIITDGKQDTP